MPRARAECRAAARAAADAPLLFTAGRLVRKKGFEYLIDALPLLDRPDAGPSGDRGRGDLAGELRDAPGPRVSPIASASSATCRRTQVASWFAAADVAVVPSVRDDSGNVDGLPNTVLEALASGTPLVSTPAGGIGSGRRERPDRPDRRRAEPGGAGRAPRGAPARSARAGADLGGRARRWSRSVRVGRTSPRDSRRPTIARLPSITHGR